VAQCQPLYSITLHVCRWIAFFEDIVVESSLWQKSKDWLWIITQVLDLSLFQI